MCCACMATPGRATVRCVPFALGCVSTRVQPQVSHLGRRTDNVWCNCCHLTPLLCPAETETLLCVSPRLQTLSLLTAFPDAAFKQCTQSLAARDLAVVYALGPVSFLASLAICLALGSVLTACGARRRRRRRTTVRHLLRRQLDPEGPPSLEDAGSPVTAAIQA